MKLKERLAGYMNKYEVTRDRPVEFGVFVATVLTVAVSFVTYSLIKSFIE
jgi:hypothetical protein